MWTIWFLGVLWPSFGHRRLSCGILDRSVFFSELWRFKQVICFCKSWFFVFVCVCLFVYSCVPLWLCRFVKRPFMWIFFTWYVGLLLWEWENILFVGRYTCLKVLIFKIWFSIYLCSFCDFGILFWGVLWPSLGHHRLHCEKLCRSETTRGPGAPQTSSVAHRPRLGVHE